ncbi:hypothetical protein Tdes44962_MAKER08246 [Teratosphaeria destructans]|uniref:Uncharacterized protein n=1 Tax=Teratosphaeria destructans TaxID=418781 RepID=A0A9W7W4W1_9PEZI|nr:hypothetical protein Tdes44962_MAKER08246 [Teratosphaeria destructans]
MATYPRPTDATPRVVELPRRLKGAEFFGLSIEDLLVKKVPTWTEEEDNVLQTFIYGKHDRPLVERFHYYVTPRGSLLLLCARRFDGFSDLCIPEARELVEHVLLCILRQAAIQTQEKARSSERPEWFANEHLKARILGEAMDEALKETGEDSEGEDFPSSDYNQGQRYGNGASPANNNPAAPRSEHTLAGYDDVRRDHLNTIPVPPYLVNQLGPLLRRKVNPTNTMADVLSAINWASGEDSNAV